MLDLIRSVVMKIPDWLTMVCYLITDMGLIYVLWRRKAGIILSAVLSACALVTVICFVAESGFIKVLIVIPAFKWLVLAYVLWFGRKRMLYNNYEEVDDPAAPTPGALPRSVNADEEKSDTDSYSRGE